MQPSLRHRVLAVRQGAAALRSLVGSMSAATTAAPATTTAAAGAGADIWRNPEHVDEAAAAPQKGRRLQLAAAGPETQKTSSVLPYAEPMTEEQKARFPCPAPPRPSRSSCPLAATWSLPALATVLWVQVRSLALVFLAQVTCNPRPSGSRLSAPVLYQCQPLPLPLPLPRPANLLFFLLAP